MQGKTGIELTFFVFLPSFLLFYFIMVIKSRRTRCVEHVTHMGEMRNAYKSSFGKPEGKRPQMEGQQ
jgi:hypothetical protein